MKRKVFVVIEYRAKEIIDQKRKEVLRSCWRDMVSYWQAESFKARKRSEIAQACLYQWSIEVKLGKINNRYSKENIDPRLPKVPLPRPGTALKLRDL